MGMVFRVMGLWNQLYLQNKSMNWPDFFYVDTNLRYLKVILTIIGWGWSKTAVTFYSIKWEIKGNIVVRTLLSGLKDLTDQQSHTVSLHHDGGCGRLYNPPSGSRGTDSGKFWVFAVPTIPE